MLREVVREILLLQTTLAAKLGGVSGHPRESSRSAGPCRPWSGTHGIELLDVLDMHVNVECARRRRGRRRRHGL